MEVQMLVAIALLVAICAAAALGWGADSRLVDADRATRWWPANPRD